MNRSILLFLGLLILLQTARAGLTWESTYCEVRVPANQKEVLADFAFKNTSSAPLVISSLDTSCGCTSAKVDAKQIAAGEKGAVHVRFDIGGRKGEQVKGVVVKTSDHAKQTLTLKVLIQDAVSFSQRDFVWKTGALATPKESIIEIEPGARIVGAESMNDQFEARIEEMEEGHRYRLVVTPRSTANPTNTSIKVVVADPQKRSVRLQASVED